MSPEIITRNLRVFLKYNFFGASLVFSFAFLGLGKLYFAETLSSDFIIGNKFTLRDLVNGLHVGINLKNGA